MSFSFDWKQYKEVADILRKNQYFVHENLEEACIRTAISRIYYSCYRSVILVITNKYGYKYPSNFEIKNKGYHGDLLYFLEKSANDFRKQEFDLIKNDLTILRKRRESCDYKDNILGNKMNKFALEAFQLADNIFSNLNTL